VGAQMRPEKFSADCIEDYLFFRETVKERDWICPIVQRVFEMFVTCRYSKKNGEELYF
jgi:hypothetical protein